MFGRARPRQEGQDGNGGRARQVASSTSTWTPSAERIGSPQLRRHWRKWIEPWHSTIRFVGEAGLLELPVDVRREDEGAVRLLRRPPQKRGEALVRNGAPVEVQAVAVEAPGERGVVEEPLGVRELLEAQAQLAERGVGVPEPLRAAEVGEPRVDSHPGAGRDHERLGLVDGAGGEGEGRSRGRRRRTSPRF